ncbi:MAG TPA: 4-hydroxy-tetrahydrodipicolinate synthase [Chitinophagales bacterium]|jgi:4-hydroxy-tetrahydrodipicolinate synthase|nr:4-hydroxy-tetrahydrodipicolinate synthase [Chitinophagales bacterium]MBP6153396.1 4-hydroxy-tetrahydrodipicolinate synthase [Chitinophagales bacterium]HQV79123.1 4-hydroxy-tetrahydrodipicolinate synthase [Chitinophagales bacterium]HQW79921.1 4-hydroxy-tetrahydrodipicolinate synthase [Chitinophagales bacterium]HRB67505.1 4-hydroxy-tetrahydrodipicolinate synthase [Chitinophagales bacterium]
MMNLKGVGVALVTPFNENKEINFNEFEKVVNYVIEGGVDYVVVLGTTGESVTLNKQEKQDLIKACVHATQKRVPVIAGFGGNDTRSTIYDINHFELDGVDGILSVSPYYNKPTQEGIYEHYKTIACNTNLPIILYNVPGRTASNIRATTTLTLAHEFKNIVAIKEASNDWQQIFWLAREKPSDFLLISGNDDLIVPQISIGYDGVISVIANALPKHFSTMVHQALNGDFASARKTVYELDELITYLFEQGNPAGVKATMKHLGVCDDFVRLPLMPINADLRNKIAKKVDSLHA